MSPTHATPRGARRDLLGPIMSPGLTPSLPPMRHGHRGNVVPNAPLTATNDFMARTDPLNSRTSSSSLEVSLLDGALSSLSARMGSMYGLQELHVLVHDTVTTTLNSIRGIVEHQVNRMLETEKLGVIEKMVIHLLTEETVRVTSQGAETIAKHKVSELERNQSQILQSFQDVQEAWQQQIIEVSESVRKLSKKHADSAVALETSEARATRTENTISKLLGEHGQLATLAKEIAGIGSEVEKLHSKLQDQSHQQESFQHSCTDWFATQQALADTEERINGLLDAYKQTAEVSLTASLKPLATKEELQHHVVEARSHSTAVVDHLRELHASKFSEVESAARDLHQDVAANMVTHAMLSELAERELKARSALEGEFQKEIARSVGECAKQATLEREVLLFREGTLDMSLAVSKLQSDAEGRDSEFHHEMEALHQKNSELTEGVKSQAQHIASHNVRMNQLDERHATVKEALGNEKLRAETIFSQMQQSRSDVNYVMRRTHDIDELQATVKKMQDRASQHLDKTNSLQEEVKQWENAIEAQQGLRRQASLLRTDMDDMRSRMKKFEEEQRLCVDDLRVLHGKWLHT